MKKLTRKEVLSLLLEHCGDLRCSQEFYKREYERTLTTSWDSDRHIQIGFFESKTKEKSKFIKSNILFFEIDDLRLKEEPKEWLRYYYSHKTLILQSLIEFLNYKQMDVKNCLSWMEQNPLLASFSGSKSIHFIFKLSRFMSKIEYEMCQKAFQIISNECFKDMVSKKPKELGKLTYQQLSNLDLEGLKYPNISKLDCQVPFNCSTSPRIACDIPQDNRLKQESITFENFCEINVDELLKAANYWIKFDKLMNPVKYFAKNTYRENVTYYSQEELENILQKPLHVTSNYSKFILSCPYHDDSNESAFVSNRGWIYCSVCCVGKKWIAKVVNGKVIFNDE
jgi:hypothetical protein